MRGISQVDPAGFVDDFKRQSLWTARLVKSFSDEDLAVRPGEGSMTAADQIQQICASDNFTKSVLSDKQVELSSFERKFDVSTVKTALASIKQMIGEVTEAAQNATPEFWLDKIEPFGPEWRMTRGQIAYLMIDHDAHHRGQLTVYLRVTGKTPPMLYDPVNENEIFEGI